MFLETLKKQSFLYNSKSLLSLMVDYNNLFGASTPRFHSEIHITQLPRFETLIIFKISSSWLSYVIAYEMNCVVPKLVAPHG